MQDIEGQLQLLIPLIVAAVLSALPGWDRELRERPAGLRTHMLVGISATLITVFAHETYPPDSAARITANILTGIGFLGAGTILHHKSNVYGLTSAASIWMVAMIGIVVGYELYVFATGATIILSIVLAVLRRIEEKPDKKKDPKK